MGTMRLLVDSANGSLPAEVPVENLGAALANPVNQVWLDISDPGTAEVELLRRAFGFHELTLEEVTKPHKRPHCDAHDGYYFVVVYAAETTETEFNMREINVFWGKNHVVTIHRRAPAVLALLNETRRRWEQHEGRQAWGVACLAHTLFERLVDGFFEVQDVVRERIEKIEKGVLEGEEGAAASIFRLRKELLSIPRMLAPTRDVLEEVLRREGAIPDGLRPYLEDVQDHAEHVMAEMDTYRDLLSAALDVQVFYSFNRLGLIMKRLTAVTVIIMVPNFVASVYGMNLNHLFPPMEWRFSFMVVVAFLGIMLVWGFIHSRMLRWL